MGAKKVKDLAVKTGTYEKNGETKGRFENIGSMFKSDDGTFFLLMKRTFNPAGVHVEEGRDQILISVFDLRDDAGSQPEPRQQRVERTASGGGITQPNAGPFPDDDIPFRQHENRWPA